MINFLRNLKAQHNKMIIEINKKILEEEKKQMDKDQVEMSLEGERLPSHNEKILKIALNELGVKEIKGPGNNARVVEYHRYASKSDKVDQPDDVPWCSSFCCFVMEKAGLVSTNSLMARSWLKWGLSTKKDPMAGDVVIFWRGNVASWKGHVGIYLRTNADGSIVTLGGNQKDEVNITTYSSRKLLDIRRSEKARVYDAEDAAVLHTLARQIINGKMIGIGGKVV